MLLDGQTVYKSLDNFNALSLSFEGDHFCESAATKKNLLRLDKCIDALDGVLNNGLTATLYLFL
jgi:hypothetical protein